jgi:hypothetical protein
VLRVVARGSLPEKPLLGCFFSVTRMFVAWQTASPNQQVSELIAELSLDLHASAVLPALKCRLSDCPSKCHAIQRHRDAVLAENELEI